MASVKPGKPGEIVCAAIIRCIDDTATIETISPSGEDAEDKRIIDSFGLMIRHAGIVLSRMLGG